MILSLGLLISSLIGLLGAYGLSPINQINHFFDDSYQRLSASGETSASVLVVDIDDSSLEVVGQWPWPRYKVAELIGKLSARKPAVVGLDFILAEPDRSALAEIRRAYKNDFGLDLTIQGVPVGLTDNDGYLGAVLSAAEVVGANHFYFDYTSKIEQFGRPPMVIKGQRELLELHEASGMLENTHKIYSQLKYVGFLNSQPDEDGMLRRLPLLLQYRGIIYPHLSLTTLMRSVGESSIEIERDSYGPVIRVADYRIPIDSKGFARFRFNGEPHLYATISALDILNGKVTDEEIRDKVIFVGSSAAGLKDLYPTVFDAQFPGVKVHAVMVDSIIKDQVVIEPVWGGLAQFAVSLLTGVVISALFAFISGPMLVFAGTTAWILLLLAGSYLAFVHLNLLLSPAAPVCVTLLLFSAFTVVRYAIEKRRAYVWFKRLANSHQLTMESMAAVAESRDPETGAHIKRTQHYVKAIAEQLVEEGHYLETLTPDYIDLLFVSAPLHDIGKVGVPDNILRSAGKLDEEEFELMKKHAEYGKKIISSTEEKIAHTNFLILAGEIAVSHHEKWDGSGYPHGLSGEAIPLSGRIMAVADVYDALISRRCYKEPYSHEKATALMREGRGSSFDPAVLDAFFNIEDLINEIAATFNDENEMVLGDR